MNNQRGLRVVISGSFRKHLDGIIALKKELEALGIEVLKPNNIDVMKDQENNEFIKFVGEESKSEYELEQEYPAAIQESDVHIIFNQDGYIGSSALMECILDAGNHSFTKQEKEKGIFQTTNSQVYLLEPIDEKQFDKKIVWMIQYLIEKGDIKVGLEEFYLDYYPCVKRVRGK